MYEKLCEECKEEVNIDPQAISPAHVLGIVRSASTNVIIIYHLELNLTAAEVKVLFVQENDGEMKGLVFVEQSKLKSYLHSLGGYKPQVAELLTDTPWQ